MSTGALPKTIEHVAFIFKLNNEMVTRTLAGLTDEECWKQPGDGGNPILWLVGHLTISRVTLLKKLGAGYDHGLGPLFDRGAVRGDTSLYPTRQVIEAAWQGTRARMRDGFAQLTDDALSATPGGRAFPGVTDNASLIAFMAFHESYHVGQMGYLRRMLGHSGVAG
jgi:uncharacterized damage-inducible protein DinB